MISEKKILSVLELTKQLKMLVETNFERVWVMGEINNFKAHSSGHFYFTLKDESSQISAVMWKSRTSYLNFIPKDGLKVIARGSITIYPPRGNYQIDVEQIEQLGVGELQIAFEQLKNKLMEEGLFDAEHKKPIPEFPNCIGIVTSETGAALQDIKSVLSRRFPCVKVLLASVRVQGSTAAQEIADAINYLNKINICDVLIVGRGGGSLEDLWAFNEEVVARAIYNSKIPIISAVGHEIDFSIADFVADLRAPTPSAAAELVVHHKKEILENLENDCNTIKNIIINNISNLKTKANLIYSYSFNRPKDLVREYLQSVDEYNHRLNSALLNKNTLIIQKYKHLDNQLNALNPNGVLKRGYVIVKKDGKIISDAKKLNSGDKANLKFNNGIVDVQVLN